MICKECAKPFWRQHRDGPIPKTCSHKCAHRQAERNYRLRHQERIKTYMQGYRDRNREKHRAYMKVYHTKPSFDQTYLTQISDAVRTSQTT